VHLPAKAHQKVRRGRWSAPTTRSSTTLCRRPPWSRITPASSASATQAGLSALASAPARQRAPVGEWSPCRRPIRARDALARPAASGAPKVSVCVCVCAGTPAPSAARACTGTTSPPATSCGGGESTSGPGRPVGEAWRWPCRRTDTPPGMSSCGVSTQCQFRRGRAWTTSTRMPSRFCAGRQRR
jgi:hypothetical protein